MTEIDSVPNHRHKLRAVRIHFRRSTTSKMQTRIITADASEWQKSLNRLQHDVYHKPEYVRLCANNDGGDPIAFVAEEQDRLLFVPLLLRPIPPDDESLAGLYDAVSPYGYPCPLATTADERFVHRALAQMLATLRDRGVVSMFLRLHPLLPACLNALRETGTLVQHGQTVFFDLTRSEDELLKDMRRTTRQEISRSRRMGFVAEVDHEWRYLDDFIDAYWETMRRASAGEEYFFPPEYFYELRDSLHDAIHLFVVHMDGRLACAGVNSEVGGIVQAHLAGVRSEFMEAQPLKLLIDTARQWSKQRGNRVFHLGGGLGARTDSLFQFKAALCKGRADFYSWRAIVDPEAYRSLVDQWKRRSGAEVAQVDDFFPAYRKKLQTQPV